MIFRDDSTLISGAYDGTIRIWDSTIGSEKDIFKLHNGTVFVLALNPDKSLMASGASDRSVRLLNWSKKSTKVDTLDQDYFKTLYKACEHYLPSHMHQNNLVEAQKNHYLEPINNFQFPKKNKYNFLQTV